VNNNPFEYWVTHGQTKQSEGYAKLMTDVQVSFDTLLGLFWHVSEGSATLVIDVQVLIELLD